MTEFAKECGANNWKLLTGTRLRKQLPASLRYLNLRDEILRLVAESMGHTEKIHITKYRTNDPVLHADRISRILVSIDDGRINQYVGKPTDYLDGSVTIDKAPVSEDLADVDIVEDEELTATVVNLPIIPLEPTSSTLKPPQKYTTKQGKSPCSNSDENQPQPKR